MPVVIVVGVQWGDEGKGKLVDYLTERANLVVRFQGGNNAGHTVIVEGKKTALKLIPSGILRKNTRCLLASGVVVEPHALLSEMESLKDIDVHVTPQRLGISGAVQMIMPYHKAVDQAREERRQGGKIGTTGKGIGPTYEDAVSRYGIRFADLFNEVYLKELIERNVEEKNRYLKSVLDSKISFDPKQVLAELLEVGAKIKPYVTNVSVEVADAVKKDQFIVFEGAQGCLLDINHGTYPFVTSSNTLAAYACVSAGCGPQVVDSVIGICKSYCTRVGSGPFPTEDHGAEGERLREIGKEFGTVTGRPRRCGWFDTVATKRAIRLNGIDSLILTKLDVLTGFDTVKLGVDYTLDGKEIEDLPVSSHDLELVSAKYEELPGWKEDITHVRTFEDLPKAAQALIRRIEELSECRIGGFSVGPERHQTIILCEQLKGYALV